MLHRDANGPFRTRRALAEVPRLGPKAFEQCAGFLRIRGGDDPLDVSGVHPEAYPVVHRILDRAKTDIGSLLGNAQKIKSLRPHEFVDGHRRQLGELVLAAQRTFLFHYYREAYSSSSSTPNRMRRS